MNVNEPLGEQMNRFVDAFDERQGQTDEGSILFRYRFYRRSEAAAFARSATASNVSPSL
jgi:hypothetical protein